MFYSPTINIALALVTIGAAAGCSNAVDGGALDDGRADSEQTNVTEQAATAFPAPPADVLAQGGFTYVADYRLALVAPASAVAVPRGAAGSQRMAGQLTRCRRHASTRVVRGDPATAGARVS